jgi:hypothetical protein
MLYLLVLLFLTACVLLVVSGRLILASFPKTLGSTRANLFLFVVGGFAGMFAFPNLLMHAIEFSGIHTTQKTDNLILPVAVVGALAGGTGLVLIKLRIKKSMPNKP